MAAVIRALREYWDEAIAVGLGIVLTDVVGDTVKSWLQPVVGGFLEAKWLDAVTELLIGIGILAVGEMFVPMKWRAYTRLASFGAIGIGVANVVGTAIGLIPPTAVAAPTRRVVVRPPVRAAPAARAPEIFS